jgi:extracellular elastinolytic metalloproteinase
VRLRALTNQCTGTPAYHGDQDDDPLNVTDCRDGSTADDAVRAAELQVFR